MTVVVTPTRGLCGRLGGDVLGYEVHLALRCV